MGDREGTAMPGTKMEAEALLLTPPTPEGRGPLSNRPKPNARNLRDFEVMQGRADSSIVEHTRRKMKLVRQLLVVGRAGFRRGSRN